MNVFELRPWMCFQKRRWSPGNPPWGPWRRWRGTSSISFGAGWAQQLLCWPTRSSRRSRSETCTSSSPTRRWRSSMATGIPHQGGKRSAKWGGIYHWDWEALPSKSTHCPRAHCRFKPFSIVTQQTALLMGLFTRYVRGSWNGSDIPRVKQQTEFRLYGISPVKRCLMKNSIRWGAMSLFSLRNWYMYYVITRARPNAYDRYGASFYDIHTERRGRLAQKQMIVLISCVSITGRGYKNTKSLWTS